MKCPSCGKPAKNIKARLVSGELIEGCENCLNPKKIADYAAKYKRDRMKEDHRQDLVQRTDERGRPNPDWAKMYPEQAKEQFGADFPRI